jgi:hypothetical protein
LVQHHFVEMEAGGTAMNGQRSESPETIDRKTSRSIIEAVGERLQQNLRPETSRLAPRLQHLMDELRRRDSDDRRRMPN